MKRSEWIIDEQHIQPKPRTDRVFECWIRKAELREEQYYGQTDTWLFDALDAHFHGGDVLVVGAYEAWYESVMLFYGATSVDVLEIKPVVYAGRYPVHYMMELPNKVYDSIVCISTLEHVGLGRYGDDVDEDGDIKMMKKLRDYTSLMFLAVPRGRDHLVFNAHRIYGEERMPKILEGWKVKASYGLDSGKANHSTTNSGYQPVMVLT